MKVAFKIVLVLLLLSCMLGDLMGQGKRGRMREIGLNMTGIVRQLVPFNRSGEIPLNYAFTFSRINRAGTGAIRFSLGATSTAVNQDFFSFRETSFNLLLGYERRKYILDTKVGYRGGVHLFANAGIVPSALPRGAGLAFSQGLSYDLGDRINISTEAILYLGGDLGIFVDFVEPVAIYLNVKL